jgi:hypothetical protein
LDRGILKTPEGDPRRVVPGTEKIQVFPPEGVIKFPIGDTFEEHLYPIIIF